MGFTFHQRKWAELALNKELDVKPFDPLLEKDAYIATVKLDVDLLAKKGAPPKEPFDAQEMGKAFTEACVGECIVLTAVVSCARRVRQGLVCLWLRYLSSPGQCSSARTLS